MAKLGRTLPHDVHISSSDNNAYIVTVGCATFCFVEAEDAAELIKVYLSDPKAGIEAVYKARRQSNSEFSREDDAALVEAPKYV